MMSLLLLAGRTVCMPCVRRPFYQIILHINYLIDLSQSNIGNETSGIFSVPNKHCQFKKSVDNHRPAEYSYFMHS